MKKFLLASASRSFLKRNTNLLQRRGLQLFTAASGSEALKLHQECRFDLILSDTELEDMDGFTLCARIRSSDTARDVPVIITGSTVAETMEKVTRCGASALLAKPLDPLQLVETIGRFTRMKMVRNKRVELDVRVSGKVGETDFLCISHDVSNSGILLETRNQLVLGSRIVCEFTLPDASQIAAEGEVVRSMCILQRKSLYGVKFINLSPANRRAVEEYVNSIAKSVAGP